MKLQSTGVIAVALLSAFALSACEPREGDHTAGQQVDHALDRAQVKLANAEDKAAETMTAMNAKASEKTAEAGKVMDDAAITASLRTDILKDPDLSVLKIDIDTKDGVVTLNGLADNEAAKNRAEQLAGAVKGVKEVRNFLVVKRA